jgi:hypothetical protein
MSREFCREICQVKIHLADENPMNSLKHKIIKKYIYFGQVFKNQNIFIGDLY